LLPQNNETIDILKLLDTHWEAILEINWQLTLAIVFGFLMAVAVPVVGIALCCCSMCGKKNKGNANAKKHRVSCLENVWHYNGLPWVLTQRYDHNVEES
jgi:glucose uptake protein GlcU